MQRRLLGVHKRTEKLQDCHHNVVKVLNVRSLAAMEEPKLSRQEFVERCYPFFRGTSSKEGNRSH